MSQIGPLVLVLGLVVLVLTIPPVWARRRRRAGSAAAWVAAGVMGLVAILVLTGELSGSTFVPWVPSLGLSIELGVDPYAELFLMVIAVVGVAVFAYGAIYMGNKPGAMRFTVAMLLFAAAMTGLVVSDDVLTLFVFWELTTFSSFLLIGHHSQVGAAARSARQAALVTAAGGLAMLGGLVVLAIEAGSTRLPDLVAAGPVSVVGWALVLVGAMTKSAQFPFQGWLPRAMAAPTPASAYLHSATMVKAGIILLGRLSPSAAAVEWWTPTVITVGMVTVVVGGIAALRQNDLKLVLAYGTVSQLGLMFAMVGSGVPSLIAAGLVILLAHALYKSALFLVVGAIDSTKKTRDITRLSGLRTEQPAVFAVALLAVASMAAIPATLGFATKEAGLEALLSYSPMLGVGVAAAAVLTVAYSTRFLLGAFSGTSAPRGRQPFALLAAPAGLTLIGTALGLGPALLAHPVADAVTAVTGTGVAAPKLVLWPGPVPAFWLSLAGLAGGVVLGWLSLRRLLDSHGVTTAHGFDRGIEILQQVAERLTGILQNGSLPAYLGQIIMVAIVLPFPALVRLGALPLPGGAGGVAEWLVAILMIVAALALVVVRRRMVAVLLLGALGYGMSALFVIAGAPDVALTQILVETLVVALFALTLRVLPLRFGRRGPIALWKTLVAGAAGVFMALVTVASTSVVGSGSVSEGHLARAVPEASGANVVNVTLVDFRAADTLGEILVIGVAALGVLALVRPLGERFNSHAFFGRPSPILSRGMKVIGPLLIVFALYLLFAGHNHSGGGFAAGLVASAFVVLRWLAEGREGVRAAIRPEPSVLIGVGLAVAVVVGLGGFLWAGDFLASTALSMDLGPLGEVKAVTSLLFDVGVAVVVLGAVAGAIRGLEAS